jgi:hypothetical protein
MHTKGPVEVVNRFYIFRYGDNVADCKQSRSLPYAEMQANAARLAAGWNLLETLESTPGVRSGGLRCMLSAIRTSLPEPLRLNNGEIVMLEAIESAIRTALESKP